MTPGADMTFSARDGRLRGHLVRPAEAMAFIARLPDGRVLCDLQAAVEHLASTGPVDRPIGITGFCMGGQYALLTACSYAGRGPAFFNTTRRDVYRPEAAERAVRFFARHLRQRP